MTIRSESQPAGEDLFAEWLARHLDGAAPEFSRFCADHPLEAAELRSAYERWRGLEGVFARAGLGFGLQPEGPSESELLRRLSAKPAARMRYRTGEEIGRGGMGAVLRVWDEELRRPLAMKVLLSGDETAGSLERRRLARFLEEAQIAGQLDHPGIVPVHELGLDEHGRVFFTMKLVQGQDLAHVFELVFAGADGWNETRALSVLLKVCEALAYAHSKGVIHRDLKPANVMVGSFGEVYVMDWGLARVLGVPEERAGHASARPATSVETARTAERTRTPDSSLLTMDGDVVGTPAYMSPEQAYGEIERLSARSDVYAMGALLYHLFARAMPYADEPGVDSSGAILSAVRRGPPTPLGRMRPDLAPELVSIVEKAMARDPERRYRDMAALAEDLRAYLEHRVVQAHASGALIELRKWIERNRALAASLAVALLVLVLGVLATSLLYARSAARAAEVLRLSALERVHDLTRRADALWPALPDRLASYDAWLEEAGRLEEERPDHAATLAGLRAHVDALARDDPERWWLAQLEKLDSELAALFEPATGLAAPMGLDPVHGWSIPKRRAFAAALAERAQSVVEGARWSATCSALADERVAPAYRGLVLEPQLGLTPLGPDPDSGLWEFAHLASGEPPVRGADGRLALDADSGLVFVLLPGGDFWMGGQAQDRNGPNFDPDALADEGPPRLVTVAPFFLSKYELTQGQWLRLSGRNPAREQRGSAGTSLHAGDLVRPVLNVSWNDCARELARLGLELPSEAQWEYGARAGTSTVFWCARTELAACGNLEHSYGREQGLDPAGADYDPCAFLAPVGHYRANAFGLHDTLGNVWEWCQDKFEPSSPERAYRGGAFDGSAHFARSSDRSLARPENASTLGLRPARRLEQP